MWYSSFWSEGPKNQGDQDDHDDHDDHLDYSGHSIWKEVGYCTQGSWRLSDQMRALPRRSLKLLIMSHSLTRVGIKLLPSPRAIKKEGRSVNEFIQTWQQIIQAIKMEITLFSFFQHLSPF